MGFRRDRKQALAWKTWLAEHRGRLLETGVPEEVFADQFRWERFLMHGDDYDLGWRVDLISHTQAKALHRFITDLYGDEMYRSTLRDLEDEFGIDRD